MKIIYYGHSCFALISNTGTTVITDPYTKVGYELPIRLKADVVTTSHQHFDHNYLEAINYEKICAQAGTYIGKDVEIEGIFSYHDDKKGRLRGNNVIFKYHIDGITICHLGDLGEPCSDSLLEKIGSVDVLLIPVGGTYTIDAQQAKTYVERLTPKIAIPMHYKPVDGALDIDGVPSFLKEMNELNLLHTPVQSIEMETYNLTQSKHIIYMERATE